MGYRYKEKAMKHNKIVRETAQDNDLVECEVRLFQDLLTCFPKCEKGPKGPA